MVGQRQVASDLERNLGKLEALCHAAPPSRRKTVSVLFEYEKSLGTTFGSIYGLRPTCYDVFRWASCAVKVRVVRRAKRARGSPRSLQSEKHLLLRSSSF